MKIFEIFHTYAKPKAKKLFPPIIYDRNNVTAEEFKQYVKFLAENKINKTFIEPDKFITSAEREKLKNKEKEIQKYRDFVHYLAENNINRTFLQ